VNVNLMNKLALAAGGAHFPEVFKQNQEQYTKQVLLECYKLFQDSQHLSNEYLAMDLLFDIQKHFDIDLTTK
jgi:hypothetical protein